MNRHLPSASQRTHSGMFSSFYLQMHRIEYGPAAMSRADARGRDARVQLRAADRASHGVLCPTDDGRV